MIHVPGPLLRLRCQKMAYMLPQPQPPVFSSGRHKLVGCFSGMYAFFSPFQCSRAHQSDRLCSFQGAVSATVTQLAFSPTQNLLAWTDMDGVLTRWPEPIPASSPDPIKLQASSTTASVPMRRKNALNLFDDNADEEPKTTSHVDDIDLDDGVEEDLYDDDWIMDDIGGGLKDDNEDVLRPGKEIREMGECSPVSTNNSITHSRLQSV